MHPRIHTEIEEIKFRFTAPQVASNINTSIQEVQNLTKEGDFRFYHS